MIDSNLAGLDGGATNVFKRAVNWNIENTPVDFILISQKSEKEVIRTNCDQLKMFKYSPNFEKAFLIKDIPN